MLDLNSAGVGGQACRCWIWIVLVLPGWSAGVGSEFCWCCWTDQLMLDLNPTGVGGAINSCWFWILLVFVGWSGNIGSELCWCWRVDQLVRLCILLMLLCWLADVRFESAGGTRLNSWGGIWFLLVLPGWSSDIVWVLLALLGWSADVGSEFCCCCWMDHLMLPQILLVFSGWSADAGSDKHTEEGPAF